ncbi:uncharacterized protein F5891DRAFT_1218586 [Suillus fuscotomentosus]|uniref:Uncharacterized protein n=1 Tax=Suillus fuscotomentosus TaxID=1912939 RepID=A0AAD4HLA3_9AGAM|nr:uncharacterized protein F5891DRAFT_1218586 [Suillus fuscotomentosus]KAG1901860.1 hypothetical protein F5891DRAFT_1218586 [Suillus fuscotomentosus]
MSHTPASTGQSRFRLLKRYLTSMRTLAMKLVLLFASHAKLIVCNPEQPASERPPIPVPITHPFAALNIGRAADYTPFLSPIIVRHYSNSTYAPETLGAKPKPAALKSLFFIQHFEPAQLRDFDSSGVVDVESKRVATKREEGHGVEAHQARS